MFLGPLCFGLVCFLPLTLGFDTLGSWGGLIVLFVWQGVGRGVWENTNKAIFSMFFHYDLVGAFSNVVIQNGSASAICFFINAYGGTTPKCPEYTFNATTTISCDPDKDNFCMRNTNDCGPYASEAWAGVIFAVLAVVGFFIANMLYKKDVKTWDQVWSSQAQDM